MKIKTIVIGFVLTAISIALISFDATDVSAIDNCPIDDPFCNIAIPTPTATIPPHRIIFDCSGSNRYSSQSNTTGLWCFWIATDGHAVGMNDRNYDGYADFMYHEAPQAAYINSAHCPISEWGGYATGMRWWNWTLRTHAGMSGSGWTILGWDQVICQYNWQA